MAIKVLIEDEVLEAKVKQLMAATGNKRPGPAIKMLVAMFADQAVSHVTMGQVPAYAAATATPAPSHQAAPKLEKLERLPEATFQPKEEGETNSDILNSLFR